MTRQEWFFYSHAGYSYKPDTQTPDEGHIESAKRLAAAETRANENGITYEWRWDAELALDVVLHAGFVEIGARRGKKYDLSYHDIYIAAVKKAAYKMLEQHKKEREEAKKARKGR